MLHLHLHRLLLPGGLLLLSSLAAPASLLARVQAKIKGFTTSYTSS